MTDIVELKRKIAEYLDHYATLYFQIHDYREETEAWNDNPDSYTNLISVRYETNSTMEAKVGDIVDSALSEVELIDDWDSWDPHFYVGFYYCDLNEYETKTIGMNILNTIKTNLREYPEFNVTEIDGVSDLDLTLRLNFNRASEERVENVMNDLLRMKRVDNILDGQISKDVLKDLMDMLGSLTREEDLNLKLLADQKRRLQRPTKRRRLSLRF